jgi:hypothetical protein
VDDRFIGATGRNTGVHYPVSLVVAHTLLYSFDHFAIGLYFFKIIQRYDSGAISLFKQYY